MFKLLLFSMFYSDFKILNLIEEDCHSIFLNIQEKMEVINENYLNSDYTENQSFKKT